MASSLGNGAFYTVGTLFFTKVAGLSVSQVGLGLTVAGAAAIAASFAAGRAADHIGAPAVLVATTTTQGLALLAYPAASTVTMFTLIASVAVAGKAAQGTARATVVAQAFTGPDRVLVRARLGVVINIFIGAGAACAGLALLADTAVGYTLATLGAGIFTLASAWPLLAIRTELARRISARSDATDGTVPAPVRPSPLRDPAYLAVSTLNVLLAMHAGLLTVGVPLWITTRTQAPPVTVTLVLLLNSVLVVAIQNSAARRIHGIRASARAVSTAGLLLAMGCLTYSAAAAEPAAIAVVLLLAAVSLHTLGEIAAEIGSWGLAFDLAPADTVGAGAYQGLNQASLAAAAMIAPLAITATALTHGATGWLVLAAIFTATGAATLLIVRSRHAASAQRGARP